MAKQTYAGYLVAVVGAGPAGLYTAQYLARKDVQVVLFNRDIKPGGLVEYGIFPDKEKMRSGLKAQFNRILEMPEVHYRGNLLVGQAGDLTLDDLRQAGFQAIVITIGAQHNYWLGLPGENLSGVYHANDVVFYYNKLPAAGLEKPKIGEAVAIIGVGNVMLDVVHYLKKETQARRVTAFARRGPTEVKFDQEPLAPVAGCLDLPAIKDSVALARGEAESVGRDVAEFFALLTAAREKAAGCDDRLQVRLSFLRSPRRLVGDAQGRVKAVIFEENTLRLSEGRVVSRGTGRFETIPADTVVFSIGSRVAADFGLPVSHGNFATSPDPRFPVDGISYEVYNPELCAACEDVFVSGWARRASAGIVGLARRDAERGARAVLQYLETLSPRSVPDVGKVFSRLPDVGRTLVDLEQVHRLEAAEEKIAAERGLPFFKFSSNAEMLRVMDQPPES